jgi:hypothetical protein
MPLRFELHFAGMNVSFFDSTTHPLGDALLAVP